MLALSMLSCSDSDSNTIDPNDVVISSERIEVPNVTMLSDGGEKQITVNANCAWSLTVPETDSWLSINPTSGAKTQSITITCAANTSTNSRTSVVSISGKQRTTAFKVTQNGIEIVAVTISNFNTNELTSNSAGYSFTLSPVSDDITTCGVCYSTTHEAPTLEDQVSSGTRNNNTVTGSLTSLSANTKYYLRAFVTNASGTYYSEVKQITTENNVPGSGDNLPPTSN